MANKQQQTFRICIRPCPRYLTGGDTHILCVACLGEEDAQSALEGADCEHCEVLPLSLPSPDRSSASYQGWEAQTAVSSTPIEAQTCQLSDSEEFNIVSVNARDTGDSPPQSRTYEELIEVVTSGRLVSREGGRLF